MAKINLGKVVPQKGVDYFTEEQKKEFIDESLSIIKDDIAQVNNIEKAATAGQVWTATDDGAEWADAQGGSDVPVATASEYGKIKFFSSTAGRGLDYTNGQPYLFRLGNQRIDNRTPFQSNGYGAITTENYDYAVKAAMCDGKGTAWTAEEQQTAQERIGLGTIKSDISTLQNESETPVEAGRVWTSTEDGAEWKTPTGGDGNGVTDVQVNGTTVVADGIANIPNAATGVPGALYVKNNYNLIGFTSAGAPMIKVATATHIGNRSNINSAGIGGVIDSSNINTAVTAALTDAKHIELTADQQKTAQEVLGIVTLTQEEYDLLETKGENTIYMIVG